MFNNKAITLVFRVKDFSSTRTDLLEQALKTNILTLSQASAPTSSSSNFNIEYVIAPGINLFTTQDGANYISILIGYTYAMDDRVIERAVIEDTRVEGELVTRVVTLLREQAQATLVLSGTCRGHSYIVSKRMDYLEQRSIPNAARLAGADRISNDEYTWAVAPGANLSAIGEFARAYLQKLTFPSMPRPAEAITQLPLTKPSRSYPGMPSLSAPMTPEIKRLFGFVVFMLIAAGIPMIPSIATSFMALSGVATVMSYTSYLFVSYLPWSAIVVTMDTNTATGALPIYFNFPGFMIATTIVLMLMFLVKLRRGILVKSALVLATLLFLATPVTWLVMYAATPYSWVIDPSSGYNILFGTYTGTYSGTQATVSWYLSGGFFVPIVAGILGIKVLASLGEFAAGINAIFEYSQRKALMFQH